jgi:hypothetical protein
VEGKEKNCGRSVGRWKRYIRDKKRKKEGKGTECEITRFPLIFNGVFTLLFTVELDQIFI